MDNRKVVKDILIASENFYYANIIQYEGDGIRFEFDHYPATFTVTFKERVEGRKDKINLHTHRHQDNAKKNQELLWVDLYNIFFAFKLRKIDGRNIMENEMAKSMKDVHRKFKEVAALVDMDVLTITEERMENWLS